jgi:hypothetical protein
MMDILFGAADLYSWNDIHIWAESIRRTGFDGDVILIVYRVQDIETITRNCNRLNIRVVEASHDHLGRPIDHTARGATTQCHQMRFFHIWQYLEMRPAYRYAIVTDVHDVVFQRDPSSALDILGSYKVIAPSEGINYEDEPWGKDNLLRGFGPYIYNQLKQWRIANVGTIALEGEFASKFCLQLYLLGENRYIPNDQSGFNFLISKMPQKHGELFFATENYGWATEIGTFDDPTKPYLWEKLKEPRPTLTADKGVVNSLGRSFVMVHQYGRNPTYRHYFEKMYPCG